MRLKIPAFAVAILCMMLPACAQTPTTHPYAPLTYLHEALNQGGAKPQQMYIVKVDLTDPRVHLVVARNGSGPSADGKWETQLDTVSATAARDGLDVAVNADFFMWKSAPPILGRHMPFFRGNWSNVCGFAMTDGVAWSTRSGNEPSLIIYKNGNVRITRIAALPPDARQIVSGSTQIVTDGKSTAPKDKPAPRTVVGLDAAGKTLVIFIVDGRRAGYSAGMSLDQAADEMIRLGCKNALNLDGGGSTTLVMRDPKTDLCHVINRPSDGHDLLIPISVERAVASTFGVKVDKGARK